MRHYEIVLLIHPDQSEQLTSMMDRYKSLINSKNGVVHRVEDWGRRPLAYPVKKMAKAHYACLNIEVSIELLRELETAFKFNDSILRHLTVQKKAAETEPSIRMIRLKKAMEAETSTSK
ncbi:MAG: 30S ribosomal protein S6 [Gammaproteobacteria bacterium]|nr:30S ribosomal protein S6 [Gammaproteobacteria bacterium]